MGSAVELVIDVHPGSNGNSGIVAAKTSAAAPAGGCRVSRWPPAGLAATAGDSARSRCTRRSLGFSLGHLYRLGVPERECVDRAAGPAPARFAMAVAGALRVPLRLQSSAAVALPL